MCESIVACNAKRIIKQKGLLQYAVANKMNISPNSLNAMLNNRKIITDADIVQLACVLQVEPNELFKHDTT